MPEVISAAETQPRNGPTKRGVPKTYKVHWLAARQWYWVLFKYTLILAALYFVTLAAFRRMSRRPAGAGGVGRPPLNNAGLFLWSPVTLAAVGALSAVILLVIEAWLCNGWRLFDDFGVDRAKPPAPPACPACPVCQPVHFPAVEGGDEQAGVK